MGRVKLRRRVRRQIYWTVASFDRVRHGVIEWDVFSLASTYRWLIGYGMLVRKGLWWR